MLSTGGIERCQQEKESSCLHNSNSIVSEIIYNNLIICITCPRV